MNSKKALSLTFSAVLTLVASAAWAQQADPASPALAPVPAAASAPAPRPERIEGTLSDSKGAINGYLTGDFLIRVDQWTTDDEMASLAATFKSGGEKALVDQIAKMKAKGMLKVHNTMGTDLIVARSITLPTGERVVRVVTNRRIAWAEIATASRSKEYPFAVGEIRLDAKGKGTGTLLVAAQIAFDPEGNLQVTGYGVQPMDLLGATSTPK